MALDVVSWSRSIEQVARRVGFLATGDVTVAALVLAIAGAQAGGLSAAERARDLYPYAVSRALSELRRHLGIAVR